MPARNASTGWRGIYRVGHDRAGAILDQAAYLGAMSGFPASIRIQLLGADPVPWLLSCEEPAARWLSLTSICGRESSDPDVVAAHAQVLTDPGIQDLLDRLPDWSAPGRISGHDSPAFAPNLLNLLADMGVTAEDDPRLAVLLEAMLSHQDADGRFCARLDSPRLPDVRWTALLCDTHAITEALVRFGLGSDPRVRAAAGRMLADLTDTAQGSAWPCRPDPTTGFRGPGRKADICPQVTAEALRALSHLPSETAADLGLTGGGAAGDPDRLDAVVGSALSVWLDRGSSRPYVFGHGRRFKQAKWPLTWYNAVTLLDAVGRYPRAWSAPSAPADNTRAVVEMAACVIAYNFDSATGLCTPRSCFRGFDAYSFGQKKQPSGFATARVLEVLARVAQLADRIAAVDVRQLTSSKGGSGRALPPR